MISHDASCRIMIHHVFHEASCFIMINHVSSWKIMKNFLNNGNYKR